MSFWRCNIQLAIPKAVFDAIPASKKLVARNAIRELKALAVNINEGQPDEEKTIIAVWHWCHHDTGELCEPESEI